MYMSYIIMSIALFSRGWIMYMSMSSVPAIDPFQMKFHIDSPSLRPAPSLSIPSRVIFI